jgi:hypothetical protein
LPGRGDANPLRACAGDGRRLAGAAREKGVSSARSLIDLQLRLLDVLRRSADRAGAAALAEQMMSQRLYHPFPAIARFQLGRINANDDGCYTVSDALAADRDRARA